MRSRLSWIDPEDAPEGTRDILRGLVVIPNLLSVMAISAPVLRVFEAFKVESENLLLSHREREMVALAVSETNRCPYCLAFHSANAVDGGVLSRNESMRARHLQSPVAREGALLWLTREILRTGGHVSDEALADASREGIESREIVELMAVIGAITQANLTANVARLELDRLEAPCLPPPGGSE